MSDKEQDMWATLSGGISPLMLVHSLGEIPTASDALGKLMNTLLKLAYDRDTTPAQAECIASVVQQSFHLGRAMDLYRRTLQGEK